MDIIDQELMQHQMLQKKYRKQITTARVIMFVLAGMFLLSNLAAYAIYNGDNIEYVKKNAVYQIIIGVLLLVINILSYIRPLVPLLILSLVCIAGTCIYLYSIIHSFLTGAIIDGYGITIFGIFVQIAFSFFVVRGTIAARKQDILKSVLVNRN